MDKNHEMWSEMGMDVDKHDLLCEALPQAFGDIYLSQENRPEKMDYFNMIVSDIHGLRPAELVEAQKEGKKIVGTFCIHVPDEVVLAADAISTGLCSGSQFWVPGGEKQIPKSVCPLIKASLGARFERTCPFFRICDLFVGETTCDGKKKAWEILADDAPMYIMDIPQQKTEEDYKKWSNEIKGYIAKLEELTGNKVTEESLHDAIVVMNNKRRALKRLNDFRKLDKVPISGKDVLLIHQIAFYDDPVRFTGKVHELCDELDERVKNGVSVYPEGTKRILLTGTPLSIPNWKMHHIIETSGAAVIAEEMCTGLRYSEALVNEDATDMEGMIDNLTERYLGNINCACFTPNQGRIDDIIRYYEDFNADGIIDLNLKFCSIYDIEGVLVEKACHERDIPCMGIETDYTEEDSGQLKTRIEAFVEMLN